MVKHVTNPTAYEARLEQAGEQSALLRGVAFGSSRAGYSAWLVTPWGRWIAVGSFDGLSETAQRFFEIGAELAAWDATMPAGRSFEHALIETPATPIVWLLLIWEHLDLPAFNALWGVEVWF